MIVLKEACWFERLEVLIYNLLELNNLDSVACENLCIACNDEIGGQIIHMGCSDLCMFLADRCINNPSSALTHVGVVKKYKDMIVLGGLYIVGQKAQKHLM